MNSRTANLRSRGALIAAGILSSLVAACGGNGSGATDAGPVCQAVFSGNFSDTVSGIAACPVLTGLTFDGGIIATDAGAPSGALVFNLDSTVAGAPTGIELDLGAGVSAGSFSSDTVTSWKALGINMADCEFSAGSQSVPTGSFTLALTSVGIDNLHGTLSVTQYVKAPPGTDCGAGDTEEIDAKF